MPRAWGSLTGSLEGYLLSCARVLLLTPRLYSCLANGSADEFQRGDQLFRMRAVKDPLQIGKGALVPCAGPPRPPQLLPSPVLGMKDLLQEARAGCQNNCRVRGAGGE